jgi:hypothetical protein
MKILVALAVGCWLAFPATPQTPAVSRSQAPVGAGAPQQPGILEPQPARSRFASYQYGIAVQVPTGLYYCSIPEDWVGADHGRTLYLTLPKQCDRTAGFVLGPVAEELPRIELYYGYNVAEAQYSDGLRPARTATELARQGCSRPRRFPDVRLLGRPAVGCEGQHGTAVEVSASATYDLEHRAGSSSPDAMVSISLTTTRARLASDRLTFNSFVRSVYQCATQWRSGDKTFWIGAAPGRPECPPNAFW